MKKILLFAIFILFSPYFLKARSFLRKKDPTEPEITIKWKNSKKEIVRSNRTYQEELFTVFNENYFKNHLLPTDTITAQYDHYSTYNCKIINKQIQHLLSEIKKGKKNYTYFNILKDKNFNHTLQCGLLILKFKQYPFVLKLFMETPETIIDPYCKGFENQFFFYMSGGTNRYFLGFTRIKNLELIKQKIETNERWKNNIIMPRKWYWISKKTRWIEIIGKNIGNKTEIKTCLPSVYAIIADELDIKEDAPFLSTKERNKLIMQLCMDLKLFVDPHADNFVVKAIKNNANPLCSENSEKSYDNNEELNYSISLVDTEYFPSLVGLKEELFFTNYLEWYIYLGTKYFQDAFLRTKSDRREAQTHINPYAINWE